MKNKIIVSIVVIVILALAYVLISGDTENRVARLGVSYFDGDYLITHHGLSGLDAWIVKSGKVTSEPGKGYYHTRVQVKGGKTAYLQLPILNTVIEEFVSSSQFTKSQEEVLWRKYGSSLFPESTANKSSGE